MGRARVALGLLAILTIGLPILVAGILALVAASRPKWAGPEVGEPQSRSSGPGA